MKKILGFLLAVACSACTTANKDDIVVNIEVENMTLSKVGLLADRTTGFEIELDKQGKGSLVIPGLENVYIHVLYGQREKNIFLQKGDRVTLRFDGSKFQDGVRVEGPNAKAAEYLQSITLSEPPAYTLSWAEFTAELDKCAEQTTRLMEARNLEQECPHFAGIEKQRIRYIYAQAMLMYPMGYRMMADSTYLPDKAYYDTLRTRFVEIKELADVSEYREFMIFATNQLLQQTGVPITNSYDRTTASMKYIAENLNDQKVKQTLLRSLALEYIQENGIRNTADLQNIANAYITDPRMLKDYRDEVARHDLTAVGSPSPDFSAQDIEGKSFSLADFQGKYLYIDLWATWCTPCRAELPHLKALEKKFEGRNITFLSLSVDKDKAAWEKEVRAGQLAQIQLWLGPNSQFQQDYAVEGIPRFILLDKAGKIVNADMIRPSSEDTERLLNELTAI